MQPEFLASVEVPTQQETVSFVTAPFQIRHPNGTVLFSLELGKAGPVLRLFDYDGKPAFELCADRETGTGLFLQDEGGRDLVTLLDAGEPGGGSVIVHGRDPQDEDSNRSRLEIYAGAESGELVLRHKGEPSCCLGTPSGGNLVIRRPED